MDPAAFARVFLAVFIAELGDKTQLATLLFSAEGKSSRLTVFLASSAALVLCSAIGVFAGKFIGDRIDPKLLRSIAGIGFIAIGAWVLFRG